MISRGQLGGRPIGRCCEEGEEYSLGTLEERSKWEYTSRVECFTPTEDASLIGRQSAGSSFPMLVWDVCCVDRHRTQHCCSSASVRTLFRQPASRKGL